MVLRLIRRPCFFPLSLSFWEEKKKGKGEKVEGKEDKSGEKRGKKGGRINLRTTVKGDLKQMLPTLSHLKLQQSDGACDL